MKKWSISLILCGLYCISPNLSWSSQIPQERTTDTAKNTKSNENPTPISTPSVTIIVNPNAAPQDEKKSSGVETEAKDKQHPDWVVRFTGLLVLVTFFQLLALAWQISTTRITYQKELRAYVLPVSAVREIDNGVPSLRIILRNSGKTPAINCVAGIFRGIAPTVRPLPPIPDTSEFKSLRSQSFIAPGADIWMLDSDTLSPDEERDIRNGVRGIYAIGTISYQDVFKGRHTSSYRFMCSGSNLDTGTFVFCEEGNSTD